MKHGFTPRSLHHAPRQELPPLTWPAPLDALPPLNITKTPESPGWQDTQPMGAAPATQPGGLFDLERSTAFEESLDGLQVRELIGSELFKRLFGPRK